MKIKTMRSLPITAYINVPEKSGKKDYTKGDRKIIDLRPGNSRYPEVDHRDPRVAAQLRIYRKHSAISFDELLPCDVEVLKKSGAKTADERLVVLKKAIGIKNEDPKKAAKRMLAEYAAKPKKIHRAERPKKTTKSDKNSER